MFYSVEEDEGMNSDGNADPAVLENTCGAGEAGGGKTPNPAAGTAAGSSAQAEAQKKPEVNIHAESEDEIMDDEAAVIIVQDEDSEIPQDPNALVVRVKETPSSDPPSGQKVEEEEEGNRVDPEPSSKVPDGSLVLDSAAVQAAVQAVSVVTTAETAPPSPLPPTSQQQQQNNRSSHLCISVLLAFGKKTLIFLYGNSMTPH